MLFQQLLIAALETKQKFVFWLFTIQKNKASTFFKQHFVVFISKTIEIVPENCFPVHLGTEKQV